MQTANPKANPHAGRTALVTGGNGFVGRHVVALLRAAGWQVRTLSRSPGPQDTTWTCGTVLDPKVLARACAGVDVVLHLAGRVSHSRRDGFAGLRELHVTGSVAVLDAAAAAGVRRVIMASTSGTVGLFSTPQVADDTSPYAHELARRWPYYRTKIEAESAAQDRAAALRIELVQLRPSLVLGPGGSRESSNSLVFDVANGRMPVCPSGGLSVVDVRDVAAAFVAAIDVPNPAPTYLLGGENLTFAALFERIDALTRPHRRFRVPAGLLRMSSALSAPIVHTMSEGSWASRILDPVAAEMSACFWYIDAAAAERDLGFVARPLADTLADTLDETVSDSPSEPLAESPS